ncbi:peroxidasin-like [Ptychodera flava]|uniref:peroxidasin-like n=1 Tax=Ptychodera flava TaxID=63121 RepID=UPI00396A9D21
MAYRHESKTCDESMCFHAQYRSPDGTCNNFRHPRRGSSLQPHIRWLGAAYENGLHTPVGWAPGKLHNGFEMPLARTVSTEIISSHELTEHKILTGMAVVWGQFLAHDMQLTIAEPSHISFAHGKSCSKICDNIPPCFPIQLPANDPRRPNQTCIEFTRSGAVCGTGQSSLDETDKIARQQLNAVNSYIDASHVYGNSEELISEKRDFESELGLLEVGDPEMESGRPLLGLDERPPLKCFADETKTTMGPCFKAGDIRANEIPTLTSLHVLMVREHNRIATALASINPHWDGETLYQETKKIVGALFQHITFAEYLPSIASKRALDKVGPYMGYKPDVDASVSNVFATVALRCGHAFIAPVIARLDSDFEPIPEGNLMLQHGFFQPWRIIEQGGIDPIIRGLFAVGAKDLNSEELVSSALTEHLFETSDRMSLDLEAMDIQRGRDHGLPSYTKWLEFCGFAKVTKFRHLRKRIKNQKVLMKFRKLYGHPDNIDAFIGALVEDPIGGAVMGPLNECLLTMQFIRTRDGDRFWYENPGVFTSSQLLELKKSSLARVICDNTDIGELPTNVFRRADMSSFKKCQDLPEIDLEKWRRDETDKEAPKMKCPEDIVFKIPPSLTKKEWTISWAEPYVVDNVDDSVTVVSTFAVEMRSQRE